MFQASPGLLHVVFKDEGYGFHHEKGFTNRGVWNKVLLHQVCLSSMFEEGLLVVEEAAQTCRGSINFCNSVGDSKFVVKKDVLRLVGSPAVYLLEQVAVEGGIVVVFPGSSP